MDLQDVLRRITGYNGIGVALLVGRDGLMIDGVSVTEEDDLEELAAIVSSSLAQTEQLGTQLQRGALVQMLMEFEELMIVVETIGDDILVVTAPKPANIGLIRTAMRKHRDELLQATGTY